MTDLGSARCIPCRGGEPPLSPAQIQEHLPQIPEWKLLALEGVNRLERIFTFRDFASALAFTDRVGTIAEANGHHPLIITEWGRVTVQWWTHKIGGLHLNDFIMAFKTDQLLKT